MAFAILPHLLREVSILSLSLNFMYVMGLRLVLQSYPRRKPYMRFLYVRPEVCPRVSMFPESGFLQIPPHDRHPCLRLYPSHHRADSGLSPVRNVRRRAHKRAGILPNIPFRKTLLFLFSAHDPQTAGITEIKSEYRLLSICYQITI